MCIRDRHISIRFDSALLAARKEDAENDIFYASTGCIHGNAAIRKAHYMFGWDWGPQLPDAGIFRNISLEYRSLPKFADVLIKQEHGGDGNVALKLYTEVDFLAETELFLSVTIEDPDGNCMAEIDVYKRQGIR